MTRTPNTGLGPQVDRLVSQSTHLQNLIIQATIRFAGDFRIVRDRFTGRSYHTVTVDRSDTPLEQALGLAHELGHLLNSRGVIPGGTTFDQFVERNVSAQIQEEAAAVKAEILVRQELRGAGVPVPPQVVGDKVKINLEPLVDKPAVLHKVLRAVPSEASDGEALEPYWRDHFRRQKHMYKGLHIRPTSSIYELGGVLLASADPSFVPQRVGHMPPAPPTLPPSQPLAPPRPATPPPGSLRWMAQGLDRPSSIRPQPNSLGQGLGGSSSFRLQSASPPASLAGSGGRLSTPSPYRPQSSTLSTQSSAEPGSLRWMARGLDQPPAHRPQAFGSSGQAGSLSWIAQGLGGPSPQRPQSAAPGSLAWMGQGLG